MKKAIRPAIFKWRQTAPELILCAVRWYLRYSLSLRDVEELLEERGLQADHTTVWRWVQGVGAQIETDRQHPSDGASPTHGARVRPAHVGHRIEYVAREQCLSRSPARCLGSQAIADNRLVSEKRVLNAGLLLVA